MPPQDYRKPRRASDGTIIPRMVIEITTEQKIKLNKFLAYGEQRRVFSTILGDVLDMLDRFGHDFVTFILEREFSYRSQMEDYYATRRSGNTASEELIVSEPARFDYPDSC